MSQVKIINNMNQRLELMLQDEVTKVMKGASLAPKSSKIIKSNEVTSQIKTLAGKKLITLVELG